MVEGSSRKLFGPHSLPIKDGSALDAFIDPDTVEAKFIAEVEAGLIAQLAISRRSLSNCSSAGSQGPRSGARGAGDPKLSPFFLSRGSARPSPNGRAPQRRRARSRLSP